MFNLGDLGKAKANASNLDRGRKKALTLAASARKDAKTDAKFVIPAQAAATVDTADAEARVALMKALPWVVGAVAAAVVAVVVLKKRRK